MAERKQKRTKAPRAEYEILPFERPIVELEAKIHELEELSQNSDLNLNGEIKPLRNRLNRLVEEVFRGLDPWQEVQLARASQRPLATDFLECICEDYLELHGDRAFKEDPSIVTALARIEDHRVLVVAHRKGSNTKEKIRFNFGCAHPEGYRKALRKMRLAEKFGLPIVTLINTPGAYPGIGAEERGQAWAIAENLMAMCSLRVPIVCIVIGEGGSGGALGIGIGDRILMMEHAYYSVISPEGCAAILWKDAKRAADAAEALKLSAGDLLRLGVIDDVIREPEGAAHRAPEAAMEAVKAAILRSLEELAEVPVEKLLEDRYQKFRKMGTVFREGEPEEGAPEGSSAEADSDSADAADAEDASESAAEGDASGDAGKEAAPSEAGLRGGTGSAPG